MVTVIQPWYETWNDFFMKFLDVQNHQQQQQPQVILLSFIQTNWIIIVIIFTILMILIRMLLSVRKQKHQRNDNDDENKKYLKNFSATTNMDFADDDVISLDDDIHNNNHDENMNDTSIIQDDEEHVNNKNHDHRNHNRTKMTKNKMNHHEVNHADMETDVLHSIDLKFKNIKYCIPMKDPNTKQYVTKTILNGTIQGHAKPGTLFAILGPSGAGKSTLLHALAGRMKYIANKKNKKDGDGSGVVEQVLEGERYINDQILLSPDSVLPHATFIEQDTLFFPNMTVYETLLFRIQLKFGIHNNNNNSNNQSSTSPLFYETMMNQILTQLDLLPIANTIVGDSSSQKKRGISGGERKRLSIALHLITSPLLILLDEPTTGLDSTSAYQLIHSLRKLADNHPTQVLSQPSSSSSSESSQSGKNGTNKKTIQRQTTIIAVIHQPNQRILDKFDDVLLLGQNGQQMYYGPRSELRHYFYPNVRTSLKSVPPLTYTGIAPPSDEMGTAEYCLDCISNYPLNDNELNQPQLIQERIQYFTELQEMASRTMVWNQVDHPLKNTNGTIVQMKRYVTSTTGPNAPWFPQFLILFHRSMNEITRNKMTLILYIVRLLSMGIIYGGIYQLSTNQASISDRFGLLSLLIIGGANMGMSKTIRTFPREKSIVTHELSIHLYKTLPYFLGKALSEIPFTALFNAIFGVVVYYLTGLDLEHGYNKLWNFIGILILHGIVAEAVGLFIGAISPNSDIALAMYPAIVVLNIIFDGKNISAENTPTLLRWIPKIGLMRWGYEGLCLNEFNGLLFDVISPTTRTAGKNVPLPPSLDIHTGEEALNRFGFGHEHHTLLDVVQAQCCIALVCWFLSYLGLKWTRQKFIRMQLPSDHDPDSSPSSSTTNNQMNKKRN